MKAAGAGPVDEGETMKARVKRIEGVTLMAEADSGHALVMDASPDVGGRNLGPRPMEMLLMGMGGCSSIDVITILEKMREPIDGCEVEITARRAAEHPKVFTEIHMHFILSGKGLNREKAARAIALSAEKYCSASIMLGKAARVTHDFEIAETAGE